MSTVMDKAEVAAATEKDPRWLLVQARDRNADGTFFYSVKTTGVYCRPSCAARRPKPENVRFFSTGEEAERAGFRPCQRCQPHRPPKADQQAEKIAQACRSIEQSEEIPNLTQLADKADMSPYHFHRLFKAVTGVTPHDYATASRDRRMRNNLASAASVTDAIYDAGYNSNGRFYARSNESLGMTPSRYRRGGEKEDIRFAIGECSLGSILVAESGRGICAILLGDDPDALARDLQDQFPQANLIGGDAEFEKLVAQVVGFVEQPAAGLHLPLDVRGTAFQQRVWQALQQIPVGTTATYRAIAEQLGSPSAVRAVAQACGANALAVAIPCHRVVRSDGALSGYRWGVQRKQALLQQETRA